MKLPRLDAQPDVQAATRRLRELQGEHEQIETQLASLRTPTDSRATFAAKAEALAAGTEPDDEPSESREQTIQRLAGRLELLAEAINVQRRKLREIREAVSTEIVVSLRPKYLPILQDVANCVEALQCALARHEDFAQAMNEAGLPWLSHVPLGGIYRRPGLFRNFGTPGQLRTDAAEFWHIAREYGYKLSRKEEPDSAGNATASKEVRSDKVA